MICLYRYVCPSLFRCLLNVVYVYACMNTGVYVNLYVDVHVYVPSMAWTYTCAAVERILPLKTFHSYEIEDRMQTQNSTGLVPQAPMASTLYTLLLRGADRHVFHFAFLSLFDIYTPRPPLSLFVYADDALANSMSVQDFYSLHLSLRLRGASLKSSDCARGVQQVFSTIARLIRIALYLCTYRCLPESCVAEKTYRDSGCRFKCTYTVSSCVMSAPY